MDIEYAIQIVKKKSIFYLACANSAQRSEHTRDEFTFRELVKLCNEIIADFKNAEREEKLKENSPKENEILELRQRQKDRSIMNWDLAGKLGETSVY